MASRDYLINMRRPRLLRTQVPRSENISVALIFCALLALLAWLATTRDNFDPEERDLPMDVLLNSSRDIPIYTRPLKLWVEPGQESAAAAFDPAPFPAQTLDGEWRPVGRVKRFQAGNLYEKINGEAEKFIKQGFVELAYLVLRAPGDGAEIAIELFDQGDLAGSLGIFAEHAAGRLVEERGGVNYFTTSAGVIGRTDRYFFRVAGDRPSEAVQDKAADLITAFTTLGSSVETKGREAEPAGFLFLRGLGIDEAGIEYQQSNVFQYDFAERFWFGDAGLGDDARVFVHIAAEPEAAARLHAALLEEQAYDYDLEQSDGELALLRHRFLGTYFVVTRAGPFVYGLEQLSDKTAAGPWLRRMRENLDDGEA